MGVLFPSTTGCPPVGVTRGSLAAAPSVVPGSATGRAVPHAHTNANMGKKYAMRIAHGYIGPACDLHVHNSPITMKYLHALATGARTRRFAYDGKKLECGSVGRPVIYLLYVVRS